MPKILLELGFLPLDGHLFIFKIKVKCTTIPFKVGR